MAIIQIQTFAEMAKRDLATFERFETEAKEFYLTYFKEVGRVFEEAWKGKKYSITVRPRSRCARSSR